MDSIGRAPLIISHGALSSWPATRADLYLLRRESIDTGTASLAQRFGRHVLGPIHDILSSLEQVTGTDLLIDGGLIGGQQWSVQQEGLTKRTAMLNKLAARM